MDKVQAIDEFWNSFGLPAYDENTVPTDDSVDYPYITYNVSTDSLGNMIPLSASLWYRSTSWEDITHKAREIARAIKTQHMPIKIDGGYVWLVGGTPFSQRMSDPNDDMVRRIYLNVSAEYLTAY